MIDAAFGNWFAGFTDGEGCFSIRTSHNGYCCGFRINLRSDDLLILEEIQAKLNIGKIYFPTKTYGKSSPMVNFCVESKSDCLILREIFLEHPLRAKKAMDFKIWSEALDFWCEHKPGSSWDDMLNAKDRLAAIRRFGA